MDFFCFSKVGPMSLVEEPKLPHPLIVFPSLPLSASTGGYFYDLAVVSWRPLD